MELQVLFQLSRLSEIAVKVSYCLRERDRLRLRLDIGLEI